MNISPSLALQRETFELSRALEFFSERELTAQVGYAPDNWPAALLKELVDNALDACESANVAPAVTIKLHDDALIVTDNGPGLPLATLEKSLDYSIRVSDKTGYVSPSRGQQGNALKTLWAAPFVVTGEGRIDVETTVYRRLVLVTLDRIAQTPKVELREAPPTDVKIGTRIVLHWKGIASYLTRDRKPNFYSIVFAITDFNPHCALTVASPSVNKTYLPTAPEWQHWLPDRPTAPHWYTPEAFRALVALLLNAEQRGVKARSINEFIREFHGLSGTAKAKSVAQIASLTGAMLADLVHAGDVDAKKSLALLDAMKEASRPIKPDALGLLGQTHYATSLKQYGATADSIEYRRALGTVSGLPYVVEVAFGVKRDGEAYRTLNVGINFSPALGQPFTNLDAALSEARCTQYDPVVLLVHLACPHVAFADRGKTRAILPVPIANDLHRLVKLITARFTQAKRQANRADRMAARDLEELRNAHKTKPMTTKAAAYQVMRQAYRQASNNGSLPANARQIMYAARPLIIELTGNASPWKSSDAFTQRLLPNYIAEHPDECASWDVVFDDRGHFEEPHTGNRIGVGTLSVRNYINGWHETIADPSITVPAALNTKGPSLRYRFVLFVEKEGFDPLFERANITKRYDIALMSTKGMSVSAARMLVERLSREGVTILVLHDFDKDGFTICHTLQTSTRRYQFKTKPHIIDIGLRLKDALSIGLQSEAVEYQSKSDPRLGLIERGATPSEADFLVTGKQDGRWIGQRIELNAMDSQHFIEWLEAKLQAHGVTKFVPDDPDTVANAWRRAWRIQEINRVLADIAIADPPAPPDDLTGSILATLERKPALSWDEAIAEITTEGTVL